MAVPRLESDPSTELLRVIHNILTEKYSVWGRSILGPYELANTWVKFMVSVSKKRPESHRQIEMAVVVAC